MSTISGRFVHDVDGYIAGVGWARTCASRVELTVTCARDITRFTVERDAGHGFQDPSIYEEFYPHRGSRSLTLLDYTAPIGRNVIYRATFFGDDNEPHPLTVSIPTHWKEVPW